MIIGKCYRTILPESNLRSGTTGIILGTGLRGGRVLTWIMLFEGLGIKEIDEKYCKRWMIEI